MKRNEGECFYDYQARRLLESYRIKIVAKGLPVWVACQSVTEKNVETGEVRTRKEVVQGTYQRSMKHERKMSKAEKKAAKKNTTRLKVIMQKQEYLRACSQPDTEDMIVSP